MSENAQAWARPPRAHDYRCISKRHRGECDCQTWAMLDEATCLPGPHGHCPCFFAVTRGALYPGLCCLCEARNPYVAQDAAPRLTAEYLAPFKRAVQEEIVKILRARHSALVPLVAPVDQEGTQ